MPGRIHGETPQINGKQYPSPEYLAWREMITRCYNRRSKRYLDYGGRGIDVCDRWRFGDGRHPVICFIEDMGRRPGPGYSIDRINNEGNYWKGNCRWATRKEQANNRRPRRNTTGVPGAQRCRNKFKAQLKVGNRIIHLGVFDTAEQASAAYKEAKLKQEALV